MAFTAINLSLTIKVAASYGHSNVVQLLLEPEIRRHIHRCRWSGRIDGFTCTDRSGAAWIAIYRMQQQPDRSWRIDGCVLTRDTGVTA